MKRLFQLFFILNIFSFYHSIALASESVDINFSEQGKFIKKVNLGNPNKSDNVIHIYLSPTCLHCMSFLINDVEKFLEKNKNKKNNNQNKNKENKENVNLVIKFLPASAKDIFIMKLIQSKSKNENDFYTIFLNYIKNVLATINNIKPTEEQEEMFRGSKDDPDMIKFQVIASNFGFSNEEIINAIPDMSAKYDMSLIEDYKKNLSDISEVIDSKEVNLPLIVKKGQSFNSLEKAMKD